MKKMYLALGVALVTVLLFQNCMRTNGFELLGESGVGQYTERSLGSLAYSAGSEPPRIFGFFADAATGVGRGDYIENTHPYANVHFVNGESLDEVSEKVKKVKSLNSSAILMVQNYLYDWHTVRLQIRAEFNIRTLADRLKKDGTLSTVKGIYIIDEPYWNNENNLSLPGRNSQDYLQPSTVFKNLKDGADLILKYFGSDVLILSSEAYPILDTHIEKGGWMGFPENYNLIAMNCYVMYATVCDTELKYRKYIDALASSLRPQQRMFLTLDNYWGNVDRDSRGVQQLLIDRTALQLRIAKEKNINVLVSFLYQTSLTSSETLYGLDSMPLLFDYVKSVSANHIGVINPPARSCAPQDVDLDCAVNGVTKVVKVKVAASGNMGEKTSAYALPSGFIANRMNVEWTCQADGKWKFTHPNGFCALKTNEVAPPPPNPPPAASSCSSQSFTASCNVDGKTQNVVLQILGSGTTGSKTNSYALPSNYSAVRMDVEWTCQSSGAWSFSHPNGFCSLKTNTTTPPPTNPPATKVCVAENTSVLCTVNGAQQMLNLQILASGSAGEKTGSYSLPTNYTAEKMNLEWTCQSDGKWRFSHPNGFCSVRTSSSVPSQPAPTTCSSESVVVQCSVNGVAQNLGLQVAATGKTGDKTNSYILPAQYTVERMTVEWTCQPNGRWVFSHPNGFCSLRR